MSEVQEKALIPLDVKERIVGAISFYKSIQALIGFKTEEEYQQGLIKLRDIKATADFLESKREELASPHYKKFKDINAEFEVVKMLKEKERIFKEATGRYYKEKERKRLEDQRKLEAEAEEKRRKEANKAQDEADKVKAYWEQGRDDMAEKARARSDTAASLASSIVAPILTNKAKVEGTSFKKVWKAEAIDTIAAAKACLETDMLKQFVLLDIKGIEKLANTLKGQLTVDGVRIIEDVRVSIRQ